MMTLDEMVKLVLAAVWHDVHDLGDGVDGLCGSARGYDLVVLDDVDDQDRPVKFVEFMKDDEVVGRLKLALV